MVVQDRQGIGAGRLQLQWPLEVHLPESVGCRLLKPLPVALQAAFGRKKPVATKDAVDRRWRWQRLDAGAAQDGAELASTPGRVLLSESTDSSCHFRRRLAGRVARAPAELGRYLSTCHSCSGRPLVTGLSTNAEASTDLAHVCPGQTRKAQELSTLGHPGALPPRHRPSCRYPATEVLPMSSHTCYLCLRSVQKGEGQGEGCCVGPTKTYWARPILLRFPLVRVKVTQRVPHFA